MTDKITPAAPAEEVATPPEQTPPLTPSTPVEAAPEKQQEEPKYVTMESLEKFGDTLVKRIGQSSRDREKAIMQEVGALRKSLTAAGIQPTAEQETKLRETVEAKYDDQPGNSEEPEEEPSEVTVDEAIQYMNAQIADVFGEVGTTVTKSDPEFKDLQAAVDASWSDPKGLVKILRAADKAATAKVARLQKQNQNPAARVTGGGSSGGQAQPQARTAHEAWESAYKKD